MSIEKANNKFKLVMLELSDNNLKDWNKDSKELFKNEGKTKTLITNLVLVFKKAEAYYKEQMWTRKLLELAKESVWSQDINQLKAYKRIGYEKSI
ncbi:6047_t:CDS:2 [Gigaspora margarita]|uniref:6047_t:CDS:1 n=1 Tax=Gigaspora margarita TaxID=4874 RepID=A0ABM8W5T0_GIGMA|nr:6047_t:CDS:2 [Gigaspora margarita]